MGFESQSTENVCLCLNAYNMSINSLTNNKSFDMTKLKAFGKDKLKMLLKGQFLSLIE